jgi:hypothetical protein
MIRADRRTVLRWMGIQVALPLLSTVIPSSAARAQSGQSVVRSRFIGVFFPNGAHMPQGLDGNWNFAEALAPIANAGLQNNAMIVRGLYNGVNGVDPHWQNAAGFLSCRPIVLGDAAVARCGKSLDQVVADQVVTPLRSLEVGAPYYHVHPLNDHPGYSNDYLNRISWQTDDSFRSPIADPRQMFEKIFGVTSGSAEQIRHLHDRKKSVLDFIHKDATRLSARMPADYRPVLSTYMDTVREIELQLDNNGVAGVCSSQPAAPATDFTSNYQEHYVERYQLMNRMIAVAMQCGTTNVATMMYGPSSSDLTCDEVLGGGAGHHTCAHNQGQQPLIDRLRGMNVVHAGLLADLLAQLRDLNLLDSTLVMYGSDMSDGDLHGTENLPVLLCGAGDDLRFGEAVGDRTVRKPLSDLHLEILGLLGVSSVTSWGEGELASTGQPLPIRV